MFSFFGGGHGGPPEGDGLNHGNAPISTATIPPLEILEAAYPVMFTQWALRPNSGASGSGSGLVTSYTAAAIFLLFNASVNAVLSSAFPRPTLMNIA
jgi:N-methylhydantoinase B/oxoprolinase/acetone carboxylase alpha subunit